MFDAYEYFGAHPENDGVVFRTFAPNAQGITIVGQFNNWQEQPMEQLHQSGIWVGFSPDAKPGQLYKLVVYGPNGRRSIVIPTALGWNFVPVLAASSGNWAIPSPMKAGFSYC